MGIGLRRFDDRFGSLGVAFRATVYPLLLKTSTIPAAAIVPQVIQPGPRAYQRNLALSSVALEWSPRGTDRGVVRPWFLSAGIAHCMASPRDCGQTVAMAGVGTTRRLGEHVQLRASLEIFARSIGKTYAQLPFAVSIHQ
jgi:hypothetical protein